MEIAAWGVTRCSSEAAAAHLYREEKSIPDSAACLKVSRSKKIKKDKWVTPNAVQYSTVHPHTCIQTHTVSQRAARRVKRGSSYLSHSAISWHFLWISPSLGCVVTCVTPFTEMPSRNTAPWESKQKENRRLNWIEFKGDTLPHIQGKKKKKNILICRWWLPNSCFFPLWITVCRKKQVQKL